MTVGADARQARRVWIAEEVDRQDALLLTGRFSGYLERNERLEERFEHLEAEHAIAWGRARAATVLIRTGDSGCYFSAGERNPDRERYPDWPYAGIRLERRRPRGFEALDNTAADPPILWDVRIAADLPEPADADPFLETIRTHPAAQNPHIPAHGYPAASAAFLIEASTREQAQQIADRIFEAACAAVVPGLPMTEGGQSVYGPEVYPYRPGKPVSGPGVTY